MSERMDAELSELAYDEAEGAAESFDEGDEFEGSDAFAEDEFDAGDEFDLGEDAGDEIDAGDEDAFVDSYDEEAIDDFGDVDEGYDEGEASLEEAMALALGAEDTDEFFRRAFGAIRNIARRAAPIIGRVARTVAPIASAIPLPWTQGIGQVAGLLGQLRAEGASEEEAMDAFAELAAYDESVLPILAGLAARNVVGRNIARIPLGARRQIVRNITSAGRHLVRRRGPAAARALPRVARSVRRAAAVRRTPVAARPQLVARTAQRVARQPRLLQRLARPVPAARARVARVIRRTGAPVRGVGTIGRVANLGTVRSVSVGPVSRRRSWTVRGPVRITITNV